MPLKDQKATSTVHLLLWVSKAIKLSQN